MAVRQTFAPGQSVTVLTDDGFVFVGKIISCDCKFECEVCDERGEHQHHHSDLDPCEEEKEEHKEKKQKVEVEERERFLVLQLEEDVEVEKEEKKEEHSRYKKVVFEEGDTVFINFDQIIAVGQGFPPDEKGKGD